MVFPLIMKLKEVQVKKYSADVELDLQKRLVSTELRNFKAKKESAIEPLCEEFMVQKKNGKSPEELKIMADNILFEIFFEYVELGEDVDSSFVLVTFDSFFCLDMKVLDLVISYQ